MSKSKFFWLHIKKAGGTSFRKSFSPPYVETERGLNCKPFVALPKEEWNDALNNFRIPLGSYDYKRMLFARKFLYEKDEFEEMFKFVIVRNPYARALSAWRYLMKDRLVFHPKKLAMKYSFHQFLKEVPRYWKEKKNRHIATHTAPIWPDITDENGKLLVDEIIKLEEFDQHIDKLNTELDIEIDELSHVNQSGNAHSYRKHYTKDTRKLVEQLYADDIKKLGYRF